MHFPRLDLVKKGPRVAKSADYCSPDFNVVDGEFRLLNAVIFIESAASYRLECISRRILLLDDIVGASEGRLHNAARSAEDHAGSGTVMHRTVALDILKRLRTDVCGADHLNQFSGGDDHIDIVSGIFFIEQFHLALGFFCYARHYGYGKYLVGAYSKLLCKICLHRRSEHLLRRFGCGQIFHKVRELALDETDPSRTAGCEHRPVFKLSVCEAGNEFVPFLHDGEVC